MKTKLRTMLLAAAGVLGSVAVAHAQPAPDPAQPAPAPPAPQLPLLPPRCPRPGAPAPGAAAPGAAAPGALAPAAVDPNAPAVAPTATPGAPGAVSPPPVAWGSAPPPPPPGLPADAAPPEAPKKPNPFGFTRFTWNNPPRPRSSASGATTSAPTTKSTRWIRPQHSLHVPEHAENKLFANVAGGVEVELTNGSTTRLRTPLLRDTSAGLGYTRGLFVSDDKETRTSVQVSGSASLPTSDLSRQQGKYVGSSLTVALFHSQKLAGSKSDWFPDVFVYGGANWGHTFSRAYTPTSTDLAVTQRPRNVACDRDAGCVDQSDQLSGYSLSHDTLRFSGAFISASTRTSSRSGTAGRSPSGTSTRSAISA